MAVPPYSVANGTNRATTLVSDVKSIKAWVAPEDRVLGNVSNATTHFAHDREELTCLYMAPHLTRFMNSQQKTLSISGKQGSGKTVLASVIVDYLQHPINGITCSTIFIPISELPNPTCQLGQMN